MRDSETHPQQEQNDGGHASSPLFRPEAVEAQGNRYYGEILLLRPLSLAFFCWLGTAVAAAVAGFLFLGSYTETGHVAGALRLAEGGPEARFDVPARWKDYVHAGEQVPIRCRSCSDPYLNRSTGVITEVIGPAEGPGSHSAGDAPREPQYRIVIALDRDAHGPLREGARIEAALPLQRHRLFRWIFSRSSA